MPDPPTPPEPPAPPASAPPALTLRTHGLPLPPARQPGWRTSTATPPPPEKPPVVVPPHVDPRAPAAPAVSATTLDQAQSSARSPGTRPSPHPTKPARLVQPAQTDQLIAQPVVPAIQTTQPGPANSSSISAPSASSNPAPSATSAVSTFSAAVAPSSGPSTVASASLPDSRALKRINEHARHSFMSKANAAEAIKTTAAPAGASKTPIQATAPTTTGVLHAEPAGMSAASSPMAPAPSPVPRTVPPSTSAAPPEAGDALEAGNCVATTTAASAATTVLPITAPPPATRPTPTPPAMLQAQQHQQQPLHYQQQQWRPQQQQQQPSQQTQPVTSAPVNWSPNQNAGFVPQQGQRSIKDLLAQSFSQVDAWNEGWRRSFHAQLNAAANEQQETYRNLVGHICGLYDNELQSQTRQLERICDDNREQRRANIQKSEMIQKQGVDLAAGKRTLVDTITELDRLRSELGDIKAANAAETDKLRSGLVTLRRAHAAEVAKLQAKTSEADRLRDELDQLKAAHAANAAEVDGLRSTLNKLRTIQADGAARLQANTLELNKLRTTQVDEAARLQAKTEEADRLRNELDQLKHVHAAEVDALRGGLKSAHAAEADTLRSELNTLRSTQVDDAAKLQARTAEADRLRDELDRLKSAQVAEASALRGELDALRSTQVDEAARLEAKTSEASRLRDELDRLKSAHTAARPKTEAPIVKREPEQPSPSTSSRANGSSLLKRPRPSEGRGAPPAQRMRVDPRTVDPLAVTEWVRHKALTKLAPIHNGRHTCDICMMEWRRGERARTGVRPSKDVSRRFPIDEGLVVEHLMAHSDITQIYVHLNARKSGGM